MTDDDPLDLAAEQSERDKKQRECDHANRAERESLRGNKSFGDGTYRPGISDRLPQSRPSEAPGDSVGVSDRPTGAHPYDPGSRVGRGELGSRRAGTDACLYQASRETEKRLGELPPLPKDTSALVKGVGIVEGTLKLGGLVAKVADAAVTGAVLEAGGAILMAGTMAHEFLEARKEWAELGGKGLEMAGSYLSVKVMGGDANLANNPHVQRGVPYTAKELDMEINKRLPGAWDGWAFEQAGAGEKAREHMNRGLADVADAANRVLRCCSTPEERQVALGHFASTMHERIERDMARRAQELRDSKRRR